MAFTKKTPKSELADTTPYTVYYPHKTPVEQRRWTDPWYQFLSIDPARKALALRIERRHFTGWIQVLAFSLTDVIQKDTDMTMAFSRVTEFLMQFMSLILMCHFVIVERQLPLNYKSTRIMQHILSFCMIHLANAPLLPSIIEIDSKLKGKMLGVPKGCHDKELKKWSIMRARQLLIMRQDAWSIEVMNYYFTKQDDLADTVCQVEAICKTWGLKPITPEYIDPLLSNNSNSSGMVNCLPTIT